MIKLFTFLVIGIFVSLTTIKAQTWAPTGADINGSENNYLGQSVCLSSNGLVMAVGANGSASGAGQVRVYKYQRGAWVQVGADINGEAAGDFSGCSVSLSSDGSVVAIGAAGNSGSGYSAGQVRVYKNQNGTWAQVGTDIDGEAAGDNSGTSVSLSSDGSVVAIGAHGNDGKGTDAGQVRVYKNQNGTWIQVGADIDGKAAGDYLGGSIKLSSDGSVVAIGAHRSSGKGTDAGQVRVYKNQNGTWAQVGADIDGEAASDFSGGSVSLSSDGSVVAIGAFRNDGNGTDAGQVRVYKNQNGTWTQEGTDIDGEAAGDNSGSSVSLSSDGSVVAIGAVGNNGNGSYAGQVRAYKNQNGTWTQIGIDMDGKTAGDYFGNSVSLNSDGSVVAIGAYKNSVNGTYAGQVRVYGLVQPTAQAAHEGNALAFDGTDDYVNCGNLNPTTFTIEAWVNPSVVNSEQAIISTLSNLYSSYGMELHIIAPGKPVITMRSGVNWVDLISPNSIAVDTWSHLAATYDGATCKLYINGTLVNSVALTNYIPGNGAMYLGRRYNDLLLYPFKGKIDETAVWNTARTAEEIIADVAGIVPAAHISLKAYYTFNQGIAEGNNSGLTTLTDTTANKLKGTLANFALSGTTSNWVYGVWQPSVTTQLLSALTSTSATVNWDLTLLGNPALTAHGICWNTSGTPTLTGTHADNVSISATGAFTYNLTNLTPGTDYYVRAYATSIMGTVYGREIKFTTPQNAPVIAYGNTTLSYPAGSTITAISPINTGGAVPATIPGNIIVFAGSGSPGSLDATGTSASFDFPNSIATDHSNNVFIADKNNYKIRKINPDGVVTTLAGSGSQGSDDGTSTAASFNQPFGVATDAAGNVYVADPYNALIRKIMPLGVVTTLAGSGKFEGIDGTALAASFSNATGVATDALGNVYVADLFNYKIRKITPEGMVTTLAGSGSEGSLDATGIAASFNYPDDVATDALGNVYVADMKNHKIRKITPEGVVTTLAGTGINSSSDGIGLAAGFSYPGGIATDAANNIYVAESGSIRKITPDGIVTTLANPGSPVSYTDVATDAAGNLYTTDANGNRILKITPYGYSISPTLPVGLNFDATTGTISGTPSVTSVPRQYTITASNYAGTNSTTITLTIDDISSSVSTLPVSNITTTTATGNGIITSLGIPNPSAYGVCWNTTGTPTTSDNIVDNGAALATGPFFASITGLAANTKYYVCAYATNSAGTSYGTTVFFTTNTTTGIQNSQTLEVCLYPNPASDIVYIKGLKGLVHIYDMSGHLVLTQQIDKNNSISINSLVNGIYLVKINGKEYKLIKK
jgi:hypothetical protein